LLSGFKIIKRETYQPGLYHTLGEVDSFGSFCFLVNACDVVWVKYFRNTSEASWITTHHVGVAWRQNQQRDVCSRRK